MMEMQVCRSRRFLEFAIPKMQAAFNNPGPWWNIENMIRVYHNVDRSLIRVDADEVTYPLHIIVRYRLEQKLLAGELDVADIPEAWNESFADLVGTSVENSDQFELALKQIERGLSEIGFTSYDAAAARKIRRSRSALPMAIFSRWWRGSVITST